MNETQLFWIGMLLGGGIAVVAGIGTIWKLRGEEVQKKVELWPRGRWAGMILGWAALLWCIPHAEVVSPNFLLPFLLPLALVIPVLSFFFLDYPLARALGGVMILFAYFVVHGAFEQHAPLGLASTVTAWLWGIGGIWISGKPCSLRDWLRCCCRSGRWRLMSGAGLLIFGGCWLLCGILTAVRPEA